MNFKMTSLLLSAGLVLAACGNDNTNQQNEKQSNNETKTEQSQKSTQQQDSQNTNSQTIALKDIQTKPEDAIKTAKAAFDGEIKQIEYKKDKGEWIYEIDLRKGQDEAEVKVSDKDNKVINKKTEKEMDKDNDPTIQYSDAMTYDQAVKKAQDQEQGDVKQWKLDNDDGRLVYEVELNGKNGEKEYVLDAKTGEVLEQDQD